LFASHVVYGLRVAANMALPGLPLRPDLDAYDVRIVLKEWATFPTTFPASVEILYTSPGDPVPGQANLRVCVLPGGDYFGFFYRDEVRFAVERQGREVWGDWPGNYTLEDACTYLLGPVLGFVLRLRGLTCLHASAVAVDGQAIALVGSPGAGKSTTAAAFAQSGFSVIADDVVALVEDGKNFQVQPGYPRLNLWSDSVRALFGSEEALPRITPTWDKRYLALGDNGFRFASKPLPLGAVYLLGAGEATLEAPVIDYLSGSNALAEFVTNTYVNYLLDRDMRSREFDVLARLVVRIPIRRVRRPADYSTVFGLSEVIAHDARRAMARNPTDATSADA
jgi:hypothetical protein